MTTIKLRRGTAAEWTAANPILAAGEAGFEIDTGRHKIGNGGSHWAALDYYWPEDDISNLVDQKVEAHKAETDTGKFKIGDGATAWNSLKYFINADDVSSAVNEAIEGYIAVDDLKTLAAAAATYADFQTAIAAL